MIDLPDNEEDTGRLVINIDAMLSGLLVATQRTVELVSIGLAIEEDQIPPEAGRLPGVHLQTRLAPPIPALVAVERQRQWVLSNGLRDLIEHIAWYLWDANRVNWMWNQPTDRRLETATLFAELSAEEQRFESKNFGAKLSHFSQAFGIELDPQMIAHAESINKVRNCLVHRQGVVHTKDCNAGGELVATWRQHVMLVIEDDGTEHPFEVGRAYERGGTVTMKIVERERRFGIGTRIEFEPSEFAGLSFFLYLFGQEVFVKTRQRGVDLGKFAG